MKLDELPLPEGWLSDAWGVIYGTDHMRAAMRAGALAALDEATRLCDHDGNCVSAIRRLRDTIAKGES